MAVTVRIHPGKRKANPMRTHNDKPRLGPLNIAQLTELAEKTVKNKDRAKYLKEIIRKQAMLDKRSKI
tara:strand:- start:3976 stop:4179 length:204 start_codon:yes stop_codon:yes gene_type:complete